MERNFTINDIITIFLKRLWLIIALALVGGMVAYSYSQYVLPKKYTSKITLYVYNAKDGQVNQTLNSGDFALSAKLVNTYMVILKSNQVLETVSTKISKLGLDYDVDALRGMITADVVEDTEVFEVSVSCGNKDDAKIIADAIEQVAPPEIIRVVRAGAVETVDKAKLATKHSSPNIAQNTIIGIVIGMVLACALAFLFELMNTSVKSKEELSEQYKLPVLTVIPNLYNDGKSGKYGKYGKRYGRYYSRYGRYSYYSSKYSYNYGYGYGYGYGYESQPEEMKQEEKQHEEA